MVKSQNEFKREVLKALSQRTISKVEAKECLKRGFGKQEILIFFDFPTKELTPLKHYTLGLEKMGVINPIIRLEDD